MEDGIRTSRDFHAFDYGEGQALENQIYALGGLSATSVPDVPRSVKAAVAEWGPAA